MFTRKIKTVRVNFLNDYVDKYAHKAQILNLEYIYIHSGNFIKYIGM